MRHHHARGRQAYEQLKLTNQSSVAVTSGESICEGDLLNGLLVHSASNYAVLLADMVRETSRVLSG